MMDTRLFPKTFGEAKKNTKCNRFIKEWKLRNLLLLFQTGPYPASLGCRVWSRRPGEQGSTHRGPHTSTGGCRGLEPGSEPRRSTASSRLWESGEQPQSQQHHNQLCVCVWCVVYWKLTAEKQKKKKAESWLACGHFHTVWLTSGCVCD